MDSIVRDDRHEAERGFRLDSRECGRRTMPGPQCTLPDGHDGGHNDLAGLEHAELEALRGQQERVRGSGALLLRIFQMPTNDNDCTVLDLHFMDEVRGWLEDEGLIYREPECSCYEIVGGHQQGCDFYGSLREGPPSASSANLASTRIIGESEAERCGGSLKEDACVAQVPAWAPCICEECPGCPDCTQKDAP